MDPVRMGMSMGTTAPRPSKDHQDFIHGPRGVFAVGLSPGPLGVGTSLGEVGPVNGTEIAQKFRGTTHLLEPNIEILVTEIGTATLITTNQCLKIRGRIC